MKKKKTAQGVAILFIMALLAGCGTSKEAAELNTYLAQNHPAPEKKSSPAPDARGGQRAWDYGTAG